MIEFGPAVAIAGIVYMVGLFLHVGFDMSSDYRERKGWDAHRVVLWFLFIPQNLFCVGRWVWRRWMAAWKDALNS